MYSTGKYVQHISSYDRNDDAHDDITIYKAATPTPICIVGINQANMDSSGYAKDLNLYRLRGWVGID